MKPTDSAGPGEYGDSRQLFQSPLSVSQPPPSFDILLDQICERLEDTNNQGSLRRIQKMEMILGALERELDELLCEGAGPDAQ